MKTESITYYSGPTRHIGYLAFPEEVTTEAKPAVLVAHAWMGQDDFARKKAEMLAELGYIGFAADLYGEGMAVATPEDAQNLMLPLFLDRKLLRERMKSAYEVLNQHPAVDSKKIGAIGFCFGGLAAIELYKSGIDVKGVVSFHGLLGSSLGEHQAKIEKIAEGIKGSLLILHGYEDPLASAEDIRSAEKELNDAKTDWQFHSYGGTSHAFTNPIAHDPARGLIYNQKSEKRALQEMKNFFQEIFA